MRVRVTENGGRRGRVRCVIGMSVLSFVAACGTAGAAEDDAEARVVAGDSILDMSVMIERFQAPHEPVTALPEDAPRSMDELLARFAHAVQDSSSAELRRLTLSEAEFAYLFFPSSMFSRPPYAQPPAVNWLLTEQNGLKGETRLLRQYGGRPLGIAGHECDPEPGREGDNTIWNQCTLMLRQDGGTIVENARLFGSVIERGGKLKFVSLANRL